MNRKNIFEENYYPSPYSIGRKREEAPKMEEREEREGREEKIKLDDSMTNSTLRMVEKLSDEREKKEEKERPGTGNEDKITYISNEVTTIRQ
jgi:spore cortex formation protein SpoVR/YcgB (stage V sporulation)